MVVVVVVVVVVVLHLHRVNKGWQLFFIFFFLRLKLDEESLGDGLKAQKILLFPFCVFSGAVATALITYNILHEYLQQRATSPTIKRGLELIKSPSIRSLLQKCSRFCISFRVLVGLFVEDGTKFHSQLSLVRPLID